MGRDSLEGNGHGTLAPYSFQKKNGDNYYEAHHVVPVSSGKDGTLNPSNMVCVSAHRHRQLY